MFYKGKYGDIFDAALNMQLINNGYPYLKYIDILSMRCCSYTFSDTKWEECLQPAISVSDAVKQLNEHAFEHGGFGCEACGAPEDLRSRVRPGDTVGPIKAEKIFRDIHSFFFSGQAKFLYCAGVWGKYHKWHCAYAFPALLRDADELWDHQTVYVIRLIPGSVLKTNIDFREVVRSARSFRARMGSGPADLVFGYTGKKIKRREGVSLQLGLYNYMLQTNKYVLFLDDVFGYEMDEYDNCVLDMYRAIEQIDVQKFNKKNDSLQSWICGVEDEICR